MGFGCSFTYLSRRVCGDLVSPLPVPVGFDAPLPVQVGVWDLGVPLPT